MTKLNDPDTALCLVPVPESKHSDITSYYSLWFGTSLLLLSAPGISQCHFLPLVCVFIDLDPFRGERRASPGWRDVVAMDTGPQSP